MTDIHRLLEQIEGGEYDRTFSLLYPRATAGESRARYAAAIGAFAALHGERDVILASAPGRTEVGGNHTDHQRGCVLAAAVDLDVLCVAAPNSEGVMRVHSEGYPPGEVSLADLTPQGAADSSALMRGVAEWFQNHGYRVGGFDAYTTSQVLGGSGLSSSAAFEVAVGQMLNILYNGRRVSPIELALAGQHAENVHFAKPSGLMDQTACSVGGFVGIDFADPAQPALRPVRFDLGSAGYHLCIVDTKGSHAGLTPDYAAIPEEMRRVASLFGGEVLREVDEEVFRGSLAAVRRGAGDRALLRAMHFYRENRRAQDMADMLGKGEFSAFLELVIRSGRSSWQLLQNVVSGRDPACQELAVALALSEELLEGKGAWRVHGGGFAGTIQAFVPERLIKEYREAMSAVFGEDACHLLSIRPVGGTEVAPTLEKEMSANG